MKAKDKTAGKLKTFRIAQPIADQWERHVYAKGGLEQRLAEAALLHATTVDPVEHARLMGEALALRGGNGRHRRRK